MSWGHSIALPFIYFDIWYKLKLVYSNNLIDIYRQFKVLLHRQSILIVRLLKSLIASITIFKIIHYTPSVFKYKQN